MTRLFTKLFPKLFRKVTPEEKLLEQATKEFSQCRDFTQLRLVGGKFEEEVSRLFLGNLPPNNPIPYTKEKHDLNLSLRELYWDQRDYINRLNSIK